MKKKPLKIQKKDIFKTLFNNSEKVIYNFMNNLKNIPFDNHMEINSEGSKTDNSSLDKKKEPKKTVETKISCKYKVMIAILIALFLIGVSIAVYFLIPKKPPSEPPVPECSKSESCIHFEELGPLEMQKEYKLKTNVNDLKRIYINQKYYLDRKTNYDIGPIIYN